MWFAIVTSSAILLLFTSGTGLAAEFFVAADGEETNDGGRESPWPSVEYALSQVGGGHTITLRPGVYQGPIVIGREYAGAESAPTVVRSEVKWQAVIVGAPYHVISNGDGCDWTVVDGFEALGARYDGIKMNGDHNVVRNCWVHNNGHMGIAMHRKRHGIIEHNLVEFNGSHVQFHHGVYADGDSLTVRGNIVRHNAGFGLHLYPSIQNSIVANNLVYGHPRKPGVIIACPEDGGGNRFVNNTVVENRTAVSIWNGRGEVVANNILGAMDRVISVRDEEAEVLVDFNLFVSPTERRGEHCRDGDPMLVEPGRGVFWLRPGSPAIGMGSGDLAPEDDFWGRPRSREAGVDVGAFPFESALVRDEARSEWYYGWAYQYAPSEGRRLPDFWALPRDLDE